ncbi:hypothetical protein C8R43DRAFT_1117414 [Mycena crocata]|nr:hypothetical protein C8R43DRAFT_1117414 [Mycena crocata]
MHQQGTGVPRREEPNLDRTGRATLRVMNQQGTGVPIRRLANIFGVGEVAIRFAIDNKRGGDNDKGADDRELATIKDETKAQADDECMVDEVCDDSDSMVDELYDDNAMSPTPPRSEKRAPRRLHISLSPQHPCLPNPTAEQLQEGFHAPVKSYGGVNMVDRLGRARLRVAFRHIKNLSALGRAYGLAHNPIGSIVYNKLWPPDDIADDHELVGPKFLRAVDNFQDKCILWETDFPWLSAFPATSSPQAIKRPTRRPSAKSKSTVRPAKARTSRRKLNSVTRQRRSRLLEDPSDDEEETDQRCPSREIDDVSSTHASSHSKCEPGPPVIPAGTFALFVATQAARNAVTNGGVTSSPSATASTGVPSSSAEVSQQASSAEASDGVAAAPGEIQQQPSSTEEEVPAALSAFLKDVGLFDMSTWGNTLVKLGFKSMDEVLTVAGLDDDRLLRTLERLLLPVNMTPLHLFQ